MDGEDRTEAFPGRRRWSRAGMRYLGLTPGLAPSPRPRWLRILSGVVAVLMVLAVIMALAQARWFEAAWRTLLVVFFAYGTRPDRILPDGATAG